MFFLWLTWECMKGTSTKTTHNPHWIFEWDLFYSLAFGFSPLFPSPGVGSLYACVRVGFGAKAIWWHVQSSRQNTLYHILFSTSHANFLAKMVNLSSWIVVCYCFCHCKFVAIKSNLHTFLKVPKDNNLKQWKISIILGVYCFDGWVHTCYLRGFAAFVISLSPLSSYVVCMLHVAWLVHVTLRSNNNVQQAAAPLYFGSQHAHNTRRECRQ